MNDLKKSGDELIALERERDVLDRGQTIFTDALHFRDGELAKLAVALIHNVPSMVPETFMNREDIHELFALGSIERLIKAGALIAAQIDVFNFMELYTQSLNSVTDGESEKGAKLYIETP